MSDEELLKFWRRRQAEVMDADPYGVMFINHIDFTRLLRLAEKSLPAQMELPFGGPGE